MRVLVTGATGLIGLHASRELVEAGHDVVTLSESRPLDLPGVEHHRADITGDEARALASRVDAVVHLAGLSDASSSLRQPTAYARVNADGTLNVLEGARASGARFILASSQRLYRPSESPVKETDPLEPVDPYGYSKLAAEGWANMYHRFYHMPVTILRFFSVYGPGQRLTGGSSGVVSIFLRRALAGQDLVVKSAALRDFTYVTDVTAAIRLALDHPEPSGTFNAATGQAVSIRELAYLVREATGSPVRIVEDMSDDNASFVADIGLARQHFGFSPRVSLRDGLRAFIDHER